VTITPEATATLPPSTEAPIPTPTLHPAFIDLQTYIASSGERFTLGADGTITDGVGTIPGLGVSPDGVMSLTLADGTVVTLDSSTVSFDEENGFGVDGYELDEDGEWVETESKAVTDAKADFGDYGFSTEDLDWIEDENGVRAIDPETGEVVYENGKFDVFYVREALVGADVLMPTKYKSMTPGTNVWPGTPTDATRTQYLGAVLLDSFVNEFINLYGYEPHKDKNGKEMGGVAFLLDDKNNSWGAETKVRLDKDPNDVSQVLLFETKDGVKWIELMPVDREGIRSFWKNQQN
jgi:hypothetical protein